MALIGPYCSGCTTALLDVYRLEREVEKLHDEIKRLKTKLEWAQTNLLRMARLYQTDDGSPGPLSDQWGWRDIAEQLREAAEKVGDKK